MNSNFNHSTTALLKERKLVFLALLVVAVICFLLIRKVSEYDIWYHMAVGKEILRTGTFPTTDQLSLLNLGHPVQARLWLFRIITAGGYRLAGFWWLQGMQIVIWSFTFWFVYLAAKARANAATALLLLLAAVIASAERFTIRPEIVSYLMIALFYWRLQQGRYRSPVDMLILFILQEIWTSSHGLFSIGPFLVACYLPEALLKGRRECNYKEARALALSLCVVAAGCLLSPIGLDSLRYTWQMILTVTPKATLSNTYGMYELASPLGAVSRNTISFWAFLLLLATYLLSLLAASAYSLRQLPLSRILICCSMLAVSMTGIRNMPLFAVVAAPLTAELLALLDSRIRRNCVAAAVGIMVTALIVWSPRPALRNLLVWDRYRFGLGLSADFVPVGLPRFLDQTGFTGSIFNSMTLGGFYEYHSAPKHIPFYDFRLEDYNLQDLKAVFDATFDAKNRPAAWFDLARRYDFRGVLLENSPSAEAGGLLPLLARDANWRLVYLDYAASFWMRADQPQLPQPVSGDSVNALVEGIANHAQAENLDCFLERTQLFPEIRQRLLLQYGNRWRSVTLMTNQGIELMKTGNFAGADLVFKEVLKEKPDSLVTLTTLSQISLLRGDKTSAERYLRKAMGYYPNDPELIENYNAVLNSSRR